MAAVALSAVDGRFALAGFSMGGRVSLEIMKSGPERVTRLALLSCSAQPGRKTISSPYQGSLEQIIETEFLGTMHEEARANPKLVDTVSAMVRRRGDDGLARQQRAIMASAGHMETLGEICCPALVICGREDPVTPLTRSEEIETGIPNATLHVLERCGHYVPLERAPQVSTLLCAWLTNG